MTSHSTSSGIIHCPSCGKPILTQVAMSEGTRFVMKCPNPKCTKFIKIITGFNVIEKRTIDRVEDLHRNNVVMFTGE